MTEEKKTENKIPNYWEGSKNIEKFTEEVIFQLTQEECEKCRYTLVDNDYGMAECYIHRGKFTHGVRLFPKYLYDIKDDIVYCRDDQKSPWRKWKPNISLNKKRFLKRR